VRIRLNQMPATRAVMWPVGVAFAAFFVVGFVLAELSVFRNGTGAIVGSTALLAIVAAGAAASVLLGIRKMRATVPAHRDVEIDAGSLRVLDAASGALLGETPLSAVSVQRARYGTETGTYPLLAIRARGLDGAWILLFDDRVAWKDGVAPVSTPHYVLGREEWLALVDALGARGQLVER
jgi:hypothetical protein